MSPMKIPCRLQNCPIGVMVTIVCSLLVRVVVFVVLKSVVFFIETPPYQESFTSNDTRKRQHSDALDDTQEDASGVNDDEDAVLSDEDANSSASTSSTPNKKRRRKEMVNFNAKFMDGVPGVSLVKNQSRLESLQRTVQDMCKWKKAGFPGCQPVSMDVKNIFFLQQKPYKVSWKADGTRYMMLILQEGEVYFFDRDNSCFQVERLRFVHRKNLQQHLTNTLLDGVSTSFL